MVLFSNGTISPVLGRRQHVVTLADAAETNALEPIVFSLLSIFGGVVLTILAGLIGAWIQGRREHSKWQRDQRLKAYGNLLAATDNFLGAAHRGDETELPSMARGSLHSSAFVRLLGPDDVCRAAEKFQKATRASVQALNLEDRVLDQRENERFAAREEFIKIARAKVKVKG